MKQTAIMDRIEKAMAPGHITQDGFLGADSRRLADILIEDDAEVKRRGLTHAAIARRMRELRDAGQRGLGQSIKVPAHFEVCVDSVRGKLPCPFGHEGVYPKTNTTVINLRTGDRIVYTDLHIHMIEAHGFYEGRGGLFRLEPRALQVTLEISPEPE